MRSLTEAQAPLARRAERVVARIRVVGGAVGVALTFSEASLHPPLMFAIEQGLYVAAILVGIVALRAMPRLDTDGLQRLMRWTFVADILIIGAIEPSNAWVSGVLSSPAGILLPVIGGLKFGVPGARLATLAFASSQVVYELLRTQVYGFPHSIENSIAVVVIGAVMGAMAGRLSTDARAALGRAERRTDAWADANRQLEEANRQLGVLHRVVLHGFGRQATTVVERMVAQLDHVPFIQVLLVDGQALRWAAGTHQVEVPGLDLALLHRLDATGTPGVLDLDDPRAPEFPKVAVAPIHGHGQILGALVLSGTMSPGRDVGEALRAMEALADQMGLAVQAALAFESEVELAHRYQELDRLKTEFISVASHELRTPLTAVNGHAETLARMWRTLPPDVTDRLIQGIQDHGRRLETLVEDLTTVGALGQAEVAVPLAEVCVAEVAAEVVAGFVDDHLVRVSQEGTTRALADDERLRSCLRHLIANAVQHGEPPVDVHVSGEGDRVQVLVHDAGAGIPLDRRELLFEPFVLARDVLAHHHGSGLGLAVVRRHALAMGGSVSLAESDEGGASFVLSLRAAEARPSEIPGSTEQVVA